MSYYKISKIKYLILLLCIIGALILSACSGRKLDIYFIDAGKGDAALIRTPENKWIMVDVGPEEEYAEVVRQIKRNRIQQLEAIFISHPHTDHAGALAEVLKYVKCKSIYMTPVEYKKGTQELNETAGEYDVPVNLLYSGAKMRMGGADIRALGPNGTFDEENDNSLVLMLEWDGLKVLFTGDQLFAAEDALLEKGWPVDCDVLKCGHHGQADASSPQFLSAASPKYCIITNDFEGEERDESVGRFTSVGAEAYVLGETGTLLCVLGDGVVNIFPVKPPEGQPVQQLVIKELDRKSEYIEIKNNSDESICLNGWGVQSVKDHETYFFPDDMVIAPDQKLMINDAFFGEIKKKDSVVLLDPYGRKADS